MREEVDVQVLTLGHLVPHQTVGVRGSDYTSMGEGPLSITVTSHVTAHLPGNMTSFSCDTLQDYSIGCHW